jgi:hypothetical protein
MLDLLFLGRFPGGFLRAVVIAHPWIVLTFLGSLTYLKGN